MYIMSPSPKGKRIALRVPGTCRKLGFTRSTLWRKAKDDPTFPKPFQLSEGVTVWDETELDDWIEAQMMKRVQS